MKNSRKNAGPHAKNEENRRNAGFTLVEMIVAVAIFGILCTAVAVNWTSFTKYQNLRADAHAFHKELMALKAKAIETGDTLNINFNSPAKDGYSVVNNAGTTVKSPVKFTGGVTADPNDDWKTIIVQPNNLEAFTTGHVELKNGKKAFRISKENNKVNPELQHNSGGVWKKI